MFKSPIVQRDQRSTFLAAALLAFVALLYLPVTGFPFLQLDDNPHLLQQDLAHLGSGWAFTNGFAWQPLTWLSHQLGFQLFGFQDAGRHHLVNLVLHLLNTGLFFWWLSKISGQAGASLAAAALFSLHPLRVESVAWVSGRGDLLAAFFVLLALEAHRRERRWVVIPLAALAMMASPAAALVGLVLIALDVWVLGRRIEWRELAPVLALGAVALVLRVMGGPDHAVLLPASAPSAPFLRSMSTWFGLVLSAFWPANLAIARPAEVTGMASILGLILLPVVFLLIRMATASITKLGLAWCLVLLVPAFAIPSVWGRADHTTYLPHLGLMMALVFSIPAAWRALAGKALAIPLLACAVLSWTQLNHFRGTVPLLQHAIEVEPNNMEARLGLGFALAGQGQPADAEVQFKLVTQARPDSAVAWVGYGRALTTQKKTAEAFAVMEQAIKRVPQSGDAHFERGIALNNLNRIAEAEQSFVTGLNLGLDARTGAIAYNNLGSYAAQRQELAKAEKYFEQAFMLDLGFALAHRNYAMSLVAQKQREKAIQHLERKAVLWTNNDRLVGEYLAALMNERFSEQHKKDQEQMLREQELEKKARAEQMQKR